MKEPARDVHGRCKYRGENDSCCFVGALIPDALYTPEFEGGLEDIADQIIYANGKGYTSFFDNNLDLLRALQRIHDVEPSPNGQAWQKSVRYRLRNLALKWKLNTKELDHD